MIKRINKMNKKGDVPVMILVIGVVVICILTIFSFVTVKRSNSKDSLESGISLFEQAHSDLEMFNFYRTTGNLGDEKAATKIGARISGSNLIIEEKKGGVSFVWEVPIS